MEDEIIAVAEASLPRRWLALAMMAALALVLVYTAFAAPPSFGWQVFLLAMGGACLWVAAKMHRATKCRIELTQTELRDSAGTRLALVGDIVAVERGLLAFKPSNGFVIRTRKPAARAWMPGLWWRFGRRIGVGGVTPASQTRLMADLLLVRLADRLENGDQIAANTT